MLEPMILFCKTDKLLHFETIKLAISSLLGPGFDEAHVLRHMLAWAAEFGLLKLFKSDLGYSMSQKGY